MAGGGFSLGSAFVSLGAMVMPEGFNRYGAMVDRAAAFKEHNIKLGAVASPTGFDAYGRHIRVAEGQTRGLATTTKLSFAEIDKVLLASSEAMSRYVNTGRRQLGLLAGEYETLAAAAKHSAEQQRIAMAEATTSMRNMAREQAASASRGLGALAGVGKTGLIGGAILGGVSAKMAGDFQRNLTLLRTEADITGRLGYTQAAVNKIGQQILDLAPKVGVGPNKLAEGLYHLASSGITASKAMEVLKTAADGARVGNSNMEDVSNALAAIMRTMPKDIHSSSEAMGVLIKIVGSGNLRMRDLVAAMTTGVVPAGKAVSLGLRDVGAALDVMTARGVPAEQASNRLRTTLNLIAHPTKKASDALAEIGLSNTALAKTFQDRGLVSGLEQLQHHLDATFPKGRKLTVQEEADAIKAYNQQLDSLGVTGKKRDKDMAAFKQRLNDVGYAAVEQGRTLSDAFGGSRMGTTMQILMQNLTDLKAHYQDLGKGGPAEAVREFNKAVEETHHNFNFQMQQFLAGMQKLMIELGQKLIPVIETAVHGIENMTNWLGKHKAVAELLAYTLGTVMVVAITALFAKWTIGIMKATRDIGTLAKLITGTGDATKLLSGQTDVLTKSIDAQAAAVTRLAEAVQAEGVAAADATVNMGRLAATGEAVTAGGVVLPRGQLRGGVLPGVAAATPAISTGEAVAAGGMGSSLLRGGRTLLGRAGSGLMIGLMGNLAAQFAGGIIGGKTGRTVGTIGGDAATGAGLGMLIGQPILGAALGGLVGAFTTFLHHPAREYGKQIASQVEAGMGKLQINVDPQVSAATRKNIETAGNTIQRLQAQRNQALHPTRIMAAGRAGVISVNTGVLPDPAHIRDLTKQIAEQYRIIGEEAAKAFNNGIQNGPKFQTAHTFASAMMHELNALPLKSRRSAAKSMLEMAAQLQHDGRLPAGAMHDITVQLGREFGFSGQQLKKMANGMMADIANEVKRNDIIKNTQDLVDQMNKTWADAPKESKVTAQNVRKVWEDEMALLREKMHTGGGLQRQQAADLYKKMEQDATHYSQLMRKNVGTNLGKLLGAFGTFSVGVANAGDSAAGAVQDVASKISKDVTSLARQLGVKDGVHFTPAKTPKAQQTQSHVFGSLPDFSQMGGVIGGNYGGGYASPYGGSPRDDHILVDPSGRPVAAMSGTEGVINAPQMDIVDYALSATKHAGLQPYGGLSELWSSGMTHNAKGGRMVRKLATGGFAAAPGTNFRVGEEPLIARDLAALGHFLGVTVTGISGYRSPQHSVAVGGFPNDPHTRGQAADIGVPGGFLRNSSAEAILRKFGLYRPFYPASAHEINHVQLLHDAALGSISAPSGLGSAVSSFARVAIEGPAGAFKRVAQAASNRVTAAANHWLKDITGGAGAGSHAPLSTRQRQNRLLARSMMHHFWPDSEWGAGLDPLWTHESGFDEHAGHLPNAYGIPQADPGAKMASEGPDWRNNPVTQIAWGLKYIKNRYGSPSKAWHGWFGRFGAMGSGYAMGGPLARAARKPPKTYRTLPVPKLHRIKHVGSTGSHVIHSVTPSVTVGGQRITAGTHQVLPKGLKSLVKFADLPGIGPINDIERAISEVDSTYGRDQRYFSLVDGQLTTDDIGHLLDLRETVMGDLQTEQGDITTAQGTLATAATDAQGRYDTVHGQAESTLSKLNKAKAQLKAETRRLARLRHVRAGKMLAIADKLARRVAANANGRSNLAKRMKDIRNRYTDKIAALEKNPPADISPKLAAVHARYKPLIAAAKTTARANALTRARDRELAGLRAGHHSAVVAHSNQLRNLRLGRDHALRPLQAESVKLNNETRHLRTDEARTRRRYEKQGWAQAWKIKIDEYKLQDKIAALRQEEKGLTGSTTGIGTGGLLGEIVKEQGRISTAQSDLADKATTVAGSIQDTALDDLDLATQQAQTTATSTKQPVDMFQFLSQSDIAVLTGQEPTGLGFPLENLHKIFQPDGSTGGGASAADTGAAAIAALNEFEAQQAQLYGQFGSNFVQAGNAPALSAAFAPGGGGARNFGAAGVATLAPGSTPGGGSGTQVFNQHNYYQTGPEDPHVHAQTSRVEFSSAFG